MGPWFHRAERKGRKEEVNGEGRSCRRYGGDEFQAGPQGLFVRDRIEPELCATAGLIGDQGLAAQAVAVNQCGGDLRPEADLRFAGVHEIARAHRQPA